MKGGRKLLDRRVTYIRRIQEMTEIYYADKQMMHINRRPEQLLQDWLINLGSSVQAKKEAARRQLQVSQYLPILIDPEWRVVFFPLHRQNDYCQLFINSDYFLKVQNEVIYLTNGDTVSWDCSSHFINRQYQRSLMLIDAQRKIRAQYSLHY